MVFEVTAKPGVSLPQGPPSAKGRQTGASQQAPATPVKSVETPTDKKEADCGCEVKAPPDVLQLSTESTSQQDVDEPIKDRVQELQNQVIEARKRQLETEINTRLFEGEAARLGTTKDKLLEREVGQKIKRPTEADAQAFYDQNKGRIQGEFKDLKDQILTYIQSQWLEQEAKKFADRLRARSQVKVFVTTATPPESDADRARLFATVNSKRITSADVEDALKPLIFSVQEQVYTLRRQSLDTRINDLPFEGEAKKRNLTPDALFDSEVRVWVSPVTEEDARKLYEEKKDVVQGTFDQLRPQIIEYLQGRAQAKAAEDYAERLRKGATVQEFLKQPDPPVFDIAIDDRPWKGGATATVTIVEFTDYECPSCAATQPVLEEIAKEFGDKVKLVVRSFPLGQHTHAFKAAEASEAAREQGKFWEYAALLFANQKALEVDKLKEYASQLGLDRKKFDAALDSGRFSTKVKRDLEDGEKIGVDSTPSVFINGKRARDRTKDALKASIMGALKDSAKKES
jgi:protein-disulfide isomerase